MIEILEDIKSKINSSTFKNEEHIRVAIVLRILNALGWDIWNPQQVYCEFPVTPNDNNKKVDIALLPRVNTRIYIEVKSLGILAGANFQNHESQLREYNTLNQATFTILTDGNFWRFYLSSAVGEFSERLFKKFCLSSDNLSDIAEEFSKILSVDSIFDNSAEEIANRYLRMNINQREIINILPQARALILLPPYPSLPQVIHQLLHNSGIEVSLEYIANFLVSYQETPPQTPPPPPGVIPPNLTPPTHPNNPQNDNQVDSRGYTFTSVVYGTFGNQYAAKWNNLVQCALRYAFTRGFNIQAIIQCTGLNLKHGQVNEAGYRPVDGTNFSSQNIDANHSAHALLALAKLCQVSLRVDYTYNHNSPYAGQTGSLNYNPPN